MARWIAARRATLLIPSGPTHDPERKHLHIVLNDPFPDAQGPKVLLACVMSIPASNVYDPSCTLFPGDHPFVGKHSFIAYNYLRLLDPALLEARVASNHFIAKPLLDEKCFQYVLTGLQESPFASPKYQRYYLASQS